MEQDPEALWQSVVDAGNARAAEARVTVGAVGLANQGETVLAWDRASGTPRSAAISWQDRRATSVCERLSGRAEELAAITGLPLDPYFAAPKMTWLRAHVTRDGVVTTTDAWLVHRLTGAFVTDAATASRTALLDLDRTAWSADACACFGIDPTELPAIVGCAEPVGETSVFGARVPVTGLAVDQQAALFAEGCLAPGDARVHLRDGRVPARDDGDARAAVGDRARRVRGVADRRHHDVLPRRTGLHGRRGGPVARARRARRVGGRGRRDRGVGADERRRRVRARARRPRRAVLEAGGAGTFVGLGLATERGHLVRAVLEGIAAQVALLAAAVEADLGAALGCLRVDGGLARSRECCCKRRPTWRSAASRSIPRPTRPRAVWRRSRASAPAPRRRPRTRSTHWSPSAVYEPRIDAAEAAARVGALAPRGGGRDGSLIRRAPCACSGGRRWSGGPRKGRWSGIRSARVPRALAGATRKRILSSTHVPIMVRLLLSLPLDPCSNGGSGRVPRRHAGSARQTRPV